MTFSALNRAFITKGVSERPALSMPLWTARALANKDGRLPIVHVFQDYSEPLRRNGKLGHRARSLKGVIDRRSNRGADRIGPTFSRALQSKGVEWAWRVLRHQDGNIGDLACGRHQVVGERNRKGLSVVVIAELLQQRAANALRQSAGDLTFHEFRIHGLADVVGNNIALD